MNTGTLDKLESICYSIENLCDEMEGYTDSIRSSMDEIKSLLENSDKGSVKDTGKVMEKELSLIVAVKNLKNAYPL